MSTAGTTAATATAVTGTAGPGTAGGTTWTRRRARTAAGTAVLALALGSALVAGTGGAQASDGRQLAGTWRVLVQPDGAPPAARFASTLVYTATGSAVEATSRMPSSAGLGTWDRLGDGRFATELVKYRFEGAAFVGTTVIETVETVAPDGESATGTATTTLYDPAGSVVRVFTSTTTSERA